MGTIALPSIRDPFTQSEGGASRFSCKTCLIEEGAAFASAAMARETTDTGTNILNYWSTGRTCEEHHDEAEGN